jgi:dipeptidyl aminopeptidase/acylaminoacyl peptidase
MMAAGMPGGTAELASDIGILPKDDGRKYRPLLHEKYLEAQPRISPNGRWLAYTSDESGSKEIYVRPFPEVEGGRWQVSTSGGDSPLWSPDGRELFYRNGDAVMAVPVNANESFSLETPKILFRGTYIAASFRLLDFKPAPWDISRDGKRFLMLKPRASAEAQMPGPRKIIVVMNWLEELKQRVPVK